MRYQIIESEELAQAVSEFLRAEARVRQFGSEQEVLVAMREEKWEGWDTSADHLREAQALKTFASRQRQQDEKSAGIGARNPWAALRCSGVPGVSGSHLFHRHIQHDAEANADIGLVGGAGLGSEQVLEVERPIRGVALAS